MHRGTGTDDFVLVADSAELWAVAAWAEWAAWEAWVEAASVCDLIRRYLLATSAELVRLMFHFFLSLNPGGMPGSSFGGAGGPYGGPGGSRRRGGPPPGFRFG